jgi:HEAT repeat protein
MTPRAPGLLVLAIAAAAMASGPARIVETEVVSHGDGVVRLAGEVEFEGTWPASWSVFFQVRKPDGTLLQDAEGKDLLPAGAPAAPNRFEATLPLPAFDRLEAGETHNLKIECHVWDRAEGKWVVSDFHRATVLTIALDAHGEVAFVGYAAVWAARLTDPDVEIRRASILALSDRFLPAKTAEPLAAAMKDEDAQVRRGAILALRHIGGARSPFVSPALKAAWKDPDGWVRFYGAEPFSDPASPDAGALDALATVLAEPEYDLRNMAAAALVRAGKASSNALRAALAAGGEGALPAACALLEIGDAGKAAFPVLDAAIEEALVTRKDIKTGWTLCGALERISPGATDAIPLLVGRLSRLGEADPVWKTAVLRAIARFGPAGKTASPGITALLGDEDERVREAAKDALRAIEGNPK